MSKDTFPSPIMATEALNNLIGILENFDEPWGIKDNRSQHVFMNKPGRFFTNLPTGFNVEGRLDDECPAPWSELAPDLREHDRRTEENKKRVAVIETHFWNHQDFLQPWYCEKLPLYNHNNQCVGTLWHARRYNFLSALSYIDKLSPSVYTLTPPIDLFSNTELKILSFALIRLSSKQIALRLQLSHRTIENRLRQMYQKAGVHSLSQFIEYCEQIGFARYIHPDFMHKGVQFLD